MSNCRKIHITLTAENFQAVRKAAFDAETTISYVIDYLIQKCLIEKALCKHEEPPVPPESTHPSEGPSQSVPTTWSVNAPGNR